MTPQSTEYTCSRCQFKWCVSDQTQGAECPFCEGNDTCWQCGSEVKHYWRTCPYCDTGLEQKPPFNPFWEHLRHIWRLVLFMVGLLGLFPIGAFLFEALAEKDYRQALAIVGLLGFLALMSTVTILVRTRGAPELRRFSHVFYLMIVWLGGLILLACLGAFMLFLVFL
jgi:hypothetical protein